MKTKDEIKRMQDEYYNSPRKQASERAAMIGFVIASVALIALFIGMIIWRAFQ